MLENRCSAYLFRIVFAVFLKAICPAADGNLWEANFRPVGSVLLTCYEHASDLLEASPFFDLHNRLIINNLQNGPKRLSPPDDEKHDAVFATQP